MSDSASPETQSGVVSNAAERLQDPSSSQGGEKEEEHVSILEGQLSSTLNSVSDSLKVSSATQDSTDKGIFPSIQEKLDKFEPDDNTKRKAETSPEISKKDKKKSKNQGKQQRKKELQTLKLD